MSSIKFIGHAKLWHDKVDGNTYHTIRVYRCKDKKRLYGTFAGGTDSYAQQRTLQMILQADWINQDEYNTDNVYLYERDNQYPIHWVSEWVTKKVCKRWGINDA